MNDCDLLFTRQWECGVLVDQPVFVESLDALQELHGDVGLLLAATLPDALHHHARVSLEVHYIHRKRKNLFNILFYLLFELL